MAKGKGSKFERDICRELSLWWSDGERNDIFWRTAGSGAMATVRGKKNKTTFGQCGDIQATDPIGQPLMDVLTIELKRGYTKSNIQGLIDRLPDFRYKELYEEFIRQVKGDWVRAKTYSWMLIIKRDRHCPIIIIPIRLYKAFAQTHCYLRLAAKQYILMGIKCSDAGTEKLFITTFDEFKKVVHNDDIERLIRRFHIGKGKS